MSYEHPQGPHDPIILPFDTIQTSDENLVHTYQYLLNRGESATERHPYLAEIDRRKLLHLVYQGTIRERVAKQLH